MRPASCNPSAAAASSSACSSRPSLCLAASGSTPHPRNGNCRALPASPLAPPLLSIFSPHTLRPTSRLRPRAAATDSSPTPIPLTDPGTRSFLSWARAAGITSTPLTPASFFGLRGMAAATPIKPDDQIISVPRSAALVLTPRQKCPFPDWVRRDYWEAAPWFVKMALLLLHQKQQGGAAKLSAYLQQLPQEVDIPVLWDDQTLQTLQYHYLIQQVKEQRMEWEALYEELRSQGLEPASKLAPPSRTSFFWALSCVRSRTFSGPYIGSSLADRGRLALVVAALVLTNATLGLADPQQTASAALAAFLFNLLYELLLSRSTKQYAMCPLLDLINHSSAVESEVSYEYLSDSFSVVASRAYRSDEQVFVNYGQSNDGLMQYYGFSEPDNARDTYVMTNLLKWVDQVAPADQHKLGQLNSANLLNALQLVSVARTGFPAQTLQALRFLLAPPLESGAEQLPSAFLEPGPPELEARLAAMLVHACKQELGSLGTSIKEDNALLQEPAGRGRAALSASERSAVAFRKEKKRVLVACLRNLGVEYADIEQPGAVARGKGVAKGFA